MFKIKKKKLFIPIIILVLTAFLALIGYISIIFLGHYVIDEKSLFFMLLQKLLIKTEMRLQACIQKIASRSRSMRFQSRSEKRLSLLRIKGSMSITALMQNLSEGQCIAIY